MNVLILDDDKQVNKMLGNIVKALNFLPHHATSLAQAKSALLSVDVAIVDVNLPDGDGYDFVKYARAIKPGLGVIMLTVRDSTEDKIQGYLDGADVYLAKPFSIAELTAVLFSLERRVMHSQANAEHQQATPWQLDIFERAIISPEGVRANLTTREALFFELLIESNRNIITKKEFVEALNLKWDTYDNRRLDTFISRLRKRIHEQTDIELPVKSDRQGSYYFIGGLKHKY